MLTPSTFFFISLFSLSSDSSISKAPIIQELVVYILKQLDKKPSKALEFFNHVTSVCDFKAGPTAYNLILRILSGHLDHSSDFFIFYWRRSRGQCGSRRGSAAEEAEGGGAWESKKEVVAERRGGGGGKEGEGDGKRDGEEAEAEGAAQRRSGQWRS